MNDFKALSGVADALRDQTASGTVPRSRDGRTVNDETKGVKTMNDFKALSGVAEPVEPPRAVETPPESDAACRVRAESVEL